MHFLLDANMPRSAVAAVLADLVARFLAQDQIVSALPGRLAIVEFGRVRFRPRPEVP